VLVPVRDFDLTRLEEEVLCRHWDVPVAETITGGDDKTMWCRSIASGAIDLNQPLPDDIWMWLVVPEKAPDRPTKMTIEFEEGSPGSTESAATSTTSSPRSTSSPDGTASAASTCSRTASWT
jgi:argininosuccinate synthase